jgi:hypothetical protein
MACCNRTIGRSTVERSATGVSSNLRTTSKNGRPLRVRKNKIAIKATATKPANSLDKRS